VGTGGLTGGCLFEGHLSGWLSERCGSWSGSRVRVGSVGLPRNPSRPWFRTPSTPRSLTPLFRFVFPRVFLEILLDGWLAGASLGSEGGGGLARRDPQFEASWLDLSVEFRPIPVLLRLGCLGFGDQGLHTFWIHLHARTCRRHVVVVMVDTVWDRHPPIRPHGLPFLCIDRIGREGKGPGRVGRVSSPTSSPWDEPLHEKGKGGGGCLLRKAQVFVARDKTWAW